MTEETTPKLFEIQSAQPTTVYQRPVQSADTLFHFIQKIDYLIALIKEEAMVPRYCVETIDYLDVPIKKIAFPMLCFCDINLHKIDEHMLFYGSYGIAFSKSWGIEQGIQPIQYINPQSPLKSDFSSVFTLALDSKEENIVFDYLQTHMYYLKAIEGIMMREEQEMRKNFTDECEWRYIPNVKPAELVQAISEDELYSRDTWNSAMHKAESCWLKFKMNDVKYVIVPNQQDFDRIIDLIDSKTTLTQRDKYCVMSKIIIWDNAKGDF